MLNNNLTSEVELTRGTNKEEDQNQRLNILKAAQGGRRGQIQQRSPRYKSPRLYTYIRTDELVVKVVKFKSTSLS